MDVLDSNLKAVEASGFRQCDLCGKVATEILIDDAIRCREKSQDVGYEVLLRWRESVPVCGISREINLLGSPKGRFGLFVHPPDVVMLDGERTKRFGFAWSNGSRGQDGHLPRRSCALMLCVVTAVSLNEQCSCRTPPLGDKGLYLLIVGPSRNESKCHVVMKCHTSV